MSRIDVTTTRTFRLLTRLPSPGAFYNTGNVLGLVVGLAMSIAGARQGVLIAVSTYLAGDGGAIALTVATAVFFVSGRTYARAWQAGGVEKLRLIRRADGFSCVGALLLGASLVAVGQLFLALAAATLHCLGKLGSAVLAGHVSTPGGRSFFRATRWLVLISRGLGLTACIAGPLGGLSLATLILTVTLMVCYFLWATADGILLAAAD